MERLWKYVGAFGGLAAALPLLVQFRAIVQKLQPYHNSQMVQYEQASSVVHKANQSIAQFYGDNGGSAKSRNPATVPTNEKQVSICYHAS